MFVLREFQQPKPSFPEIGRELGDRDHTTVMSAVRSLARKAADDEHIRDAIEIGKLALESVDQRHEIRRLALMAQRDRMLRKARALDDELESIANVGAAQ